MVEFRMILRESCDFSEQRQRRIATEDAEKAEREKLSAEKDAQLALRALQATIGRYAGCTLFGFKIYDQKQSVVLDDIRGILGNIAETIVDAHPITFVGPCGTGKDHLLAVIAEQAVILGTPVTWLWGRQVASFVEPWSNLKANHRDLPKGIICVSDPIEREDLYPSDRPAFGTLVDLCYTFHRPLWVTMNATSPDDAEAKYGTRVMDRLSHDGTFFTCDWESYRVRAKKS